MSSANNQQGGASLSLENEFYQNLSEFGSGCFPREASSLEHSPADTVNSRLVRP